VLNDVLFRTLKAYGTELVMSLNHRLDAWMRDVANHAIHSALRRWRTQSCPPLAPPTPPAPPLPPLPEPPLPPSAKSRALLRWNETDGARSLVQLANSMGGVGELWDVNKLVAAALPSPGGVAQLVWQPTGNQSRHAVHSLTNQLLNLTVALHRGMVRRLNSMDDFAVSAAVRGCPHELAVQAAWDALEFEGDAELWLSAGALGNETDDAAVSAHPNSDEPRYVRPYPLTTFALLAL
jgi:hypothetical protein